MMNERKYPLDRSPLYELKRKSALAELLKVSLKELYVLYPDERYYDFKLPKEDGTQRNISSPDKRLKEIQRRLLHLLRRIETPEWLISGKKRKSYVDNARYHQNAQYVLTIDIRKFYDNCVHKYIHRCYRDTFRTSPDVAHLLDKITTRGWGLPTGTPTSQLIAYWAYSDAFKQIEAFARKIGCAFSLYVDDMTFSSQYEMPIPSLLQGINDILHPVGHRIKYSKIMYYQKGMAKLITGAILDEENKLRVPNSLRNKIIQDLNRLKTERLTSAEKDALCKSIRGRIQAARNIEPGIFPGIFRYVTEVQTTITVI